HLLLDLDAGGRRAGQAHDEARADARARGLDGDITAVRARELSRDGEPEAGAAKERARGGGCLLEGVEDALPRLRGDARSRVLNDDLDLVAALQRPQAAAHAPADGRELERVEQEVQEDALDLGGVELRRQRPRHVDVERDAAV